MTSRRRAPLFDKPGKATGWGIAGCVLCAATAVYGGRWAILITILTALAGCLNLDR